ncbi:thioesterase domain-containing protein [Streptomyces sp. SID5910]|uniref:thioesterase II family protein n=1 Tax=Streptomyces sp. SID5910 TaxID=2690312 RepID=UPI00137092BF|nr:thioesterase domain-containing protein [Streptomyces sp. SID5910]MYR41894.1 thioesterase [Streptomyces sp. SID5910]
MRVNTEPRDAAALSHAHRRWTVPLRPARGVARGRVVMFPHAGARTAPYRPLADLLPDDLDVLGVLPPGRELRHAEAPRYTPEDAVAGVTRELAASAAEPGAAPPTVFYGHSLGSLLAVLTAHAADRRVAAPAGGGGCAELVLTCGMPGTRGCTRAAGGREPATLAAVFAGHGLPENALSAPELTAERRVLAHDLLVAHRAMAAVDPVRLRRPVTVLSGADDPLVPAVTLPLWAPFTTGPFRGRVVEGGHFFPFAPQGRDLVAAELAAAARRAAAGRPSPAGRSREGRRGVPVARAA